MSYSIVSQILQRDVLHDCAWAYYKHHRLAFSFLSYPALTTLYHRGLVFAICTQRPNTAHDH